MMNIKEKKEDVFRFISESKSHYSLNAKIFFIDGDLMNVFDGESHIPFQEQYSIGLISEIKTIHDLPSKTATGIPITYLN